MTRAADHWKARPWLYLCIFAAWVGALVWFHSRLAAVLDQNNAVVTGANAARRGQTIQVFANGLGPVDNQPASGEPTKGRAITRQTR